MRKFRHLVAKELAQGHVVRKKHLWGSAEGCLSFDYQGLLFRKELFFLKTYCFSPLILILIHAKCRNVRKHINSNNKNETLNSSVFIPIDNPILFH